MWPLKFLLSRLKLKKRKKEQDREMKECTIKIFFGVYSVAVAKRLKHSDRGVVSQLPTRFQTQINYFFPNEKFFRTYSTIFHKLSINVP